MAKSKRSRNQDMGASADAETGSRPTGQAPAGLDASRFDPARDEFGMALSAFGAVAHFLWREIQIDGHCDMTECVEKFGGNCHCMGTYLSFAQGVILDACGQRRATDAD